MLSYLDSVLNKITMYRLVLYCLIGLLLIAEVLSFFKLLPFSSAALFYSTTVLLVVALLTNFLFAFVFNVTANTESTYISACILALIISPPGHGYYFSSLPVLLWAAVLAMAVKYVFAIQRKHIFNPAAFGAAVVGMFLGHPASWWIASASMVFFVILSAVLITRKIRKPEVVYANIITVTVLSIFFGLNNNTILDILHGVFIISPLLFFSTVMLTEPLTLPPTKNYQWAYGILAGALFTPQVHFGKIYLTPEQALLIANLFSYAISPKYRYIMRLDKIEDTASNIKDLVFTPDKQLNFKAGQYLEWTLPVKSSDARGNRRYFTIASAPTEKQIIIGTKVYEHPSTFKKALYALKPGDSVFAGQLAGDFVLPKKVSQKIAFVAGGIGITPFRSMLKYLLDINERRPIILLYSVNNPKEIAYRDIYQAAANKLGIKTVFTVTGDQGANSGWNGYKGFISEEMIQKEIPDYKTRIFYISGPHTMVDATAGILKDIGLKKSQIKKDYFPGLV